MLRLMAKRSVHRRGWGVAALWVMREWGTSTGVMPLREGKPGQRMTSNVPAAHWWLSGNVKLGLIWGSVVHCDVFVLVCCAFCMLGNVHLMFLEVLDTHLVKVQGGGYFFWRRLS